MNKRTTFILLLFCSVLIGYAVTTFWSTQQHANDNTFIVGEAVASDAVISSAEQSYTSHTQNALQHAGNLSTSSGEAKTELQTYKNVLKAFLTDYYGSWATYQQQPWPVQPGKTQADRWSQFETAINNFEQSKPQFIAGLNNAITSGSALNLNTKNVNSIMTNALKPGGGLNSVMVFAPDVLSEFTTPTIYTSSYSVVNNILNQHSNYVYTFTQLTTLGNQMSVDYMLGAAWANDYMCSYSNIWNAQCLQEYNDFASKYGEVATYFNAIASQNQSWMGDIDDIEVEFEFFRAVPVVRETEQG